MPATKITPQVLVDDLFSWRNWWHEVNLRGGFVKRETRKDFS